MLYNALRGLWNAVVIEASWKKLKARETVSVVRFLNVETPINNTSRTINDKGYKMKNNGK